MKNITITDKSIVDKRWEACSKCEFLTTNEKMGITYDRCTKCGCFMKIGDKYIKIALATVKCPLHPPKWDKEYKFIKGEAVNGTTAT